MTLSFLSLKMLGNSTNKSLSFSAVSQSLGLLRGLWDWLEWVFPLCVRRGTAGRRRLGARCNVCLCNSGAVCLGGVFLTQPRTTEGAKSPSVLPVPGTPDKLLADRSAVQSPVGVFMPVERAVGSGSYLLSCDKNKVIFLDQEQRRGCAQAGERSQWSCPQALGLLKEISLVSEETVTFRGVFWLHSELCS